MPQLEAIAKQHKDCKPLHSRALAASANSSHQCTEHRQLNSRDWGYTKPAPPIASAALIGRNTLHTLANCYLKQDKITLKAAGRTAPGFSV